MPFQPGINGTPSERDLLTLEAQQVLDELFAEKLIPFKLHVGKLTKDTEQYTIHFYDSRVHTAEIPLTGDAAFRDLVRAAILALVPRITGPLKLNPPVGT